MSEPDQRQFFEIYQHYRYNDQYAFYEHRHKEFNIAKNQSILMNITLMFLAALTALFASATTLPWLRLLLLLLAAILPVVSTAIAGYSALYAFEQQAKLYQDTLTNLHYVRALNPSLKQGLDATEFERDLNKYVEEVEKTLEAEQGQWGQLAKSMKISDV
jgi:SMODS and SLOG-associating 2TM effector domain 1